MKSDKEQPSIEEVFYQLAVNKGYTDMVRSGWPDYMCREKKGKLIGIEVKSVNDRLRDSQLRTFPFLEELGLRVYVWWEAKPDILMPWRKFYKVSNRTAFVETPARRKRKAQLRRKRQREYDNWMNVGRWKYGEWHNS